MILKLDMHYQWLKLYKVYINNDPGSTLTDFTARLNGPPMNSMGETVTNSFIGEKLQKMCQLSELKC